MKTSAPDATKELTAHFDAALHVFAQTRQLDPRLARMKLLSSARLLMTAPGGFDAIYRRVRAMESAGVFANSDWAQPAILQPRLAVNSLRLGEKSFTLIEALSEIRLLAVASGDYFHPGIAKE